ncbi:hypothetical protein AXE80_11030 [Wenyingzhuangia fucanilytica]|uniref:Cupin 2 conserved barrel domain-containing protein n=1 Tax=Wenyingzhuangia fucanilytica TaxID=1790137 RepID=A0A1B1Y7P1_9FLAO|nr:hypothetical protein [Wenyingzhuangia fucanilytica]ANW96776.1 hypothetical protein AXE80_11030 [Wenyingzhuangia fucanilytica]
MKSTTIHTKGNWNAPWTNALKKAIEDARNNTQVGENLLMQTPDMKVWSIHLPVGQSLPFHKHNKPYFYVALNNGTSRSYHHDGHITETDYKKDDTKHFEHLNDENYFIHNLENIGTTELNFITVEYLKK